MPEDYGHSISVSSGISEETQLSPDAIAGRYAQLAAVREELLERSRDMAAVTIPSVFPNQETTENQALPTPYQSVGARAVNNLANKLLLTLFPVSSPFFKLEVSEGIIQQMQQEEDSGIKDDIEAKLSEMENIIQSDMETSAFRPKFFEAIRNLLIVGDYLLHIPAKGEPEGYKLNKYVVKRSNSGTVLELILKEIISREELPKQWKTQLESHNKDNETVESAMLGTGSRKDKRYDIYTRVHLEGNNYKEAKYINGILLEGSEASYPKEASAWLPLRWNGQSGEDYGRSYVEEYMGDLIALEGLSRSIQEHSAIASKTFGIIRPNSNMSPLDLARVPNGGFVVGEPEDLVYPEVGKRGDMQVAQTMFDNLTGSLSRAFLITQVRDSERTTAEEIRMMADELETALGGAYSLLAVTFQKPVLLREMYRLEKDKNSLLPKIDKNDLAPKVIVGLEGLGRGTDLEKLMKAANAMMQLAPTFQNIPGMDQDKVISLVWNAVGLDSDEVMKTEEQKKAEAQAQQAQQASSMMSEAMTKGIAGAIPKVAGAAIEDPEAVQNAMQAMPQGGIDPSQLQQ